MPTKTKARIMQENVRSLGDRRRSAQRDKETMTKNASLARRVAEDMDVTLRGQPCPRCAAVWAGHQLTHVQGCSLQRDVDKCDGYGLVFADY